MTSDEESAVVIRPHDRRTALGLVLADQSHAWGWATDTRTGERMRVIPSQRFDNVYHLASATTCSCSDFRFGGRTHLCKHVIAVRLTEMLQETYQNLPRRQRARVLVPSPRPGVA